MTERVHPRRERHLAFAEGPRAFSEMASLFSSAPFLYQAPRGERHAVLVLPGFGASDRSTVVLREYIGSRGYDAQPWQLGRNLGPDPELMNELPHRLAAVYRDAGDRKVSLVGWSLGGVYARLLAHRYPEAVRQVITLGSPFGGSPRSTRVNQAARRINPSNIYSDDVDRARVRAGEPLPGVPATAVFSKTDGIVPWQIAVERPSPSAENIEVYGSHVGLGFNPAVLYAVADRLAQKEGGWQPFERRGWKRFVYGPARLEESEGARQEA